MADATVISFIPLEINQFKPSLIPEYTIVPAAPPGDFSILHVGDAAHFLYLDADRGSRKIPEPVSEYARSICEDYIHSQIEVAPEDNAIPGIFWVYGKLSKDVIRIQHKELLAEHLANHIRWFERLVRKADDSWAQNHRHDYIAKIQREAARTLKLDKEWTYEDLQMGLQACPACGTTLGNTLPIVCPNCRCILDKEKYKTFTFAE